MLFRSITQKVQGLNDRADAFDIGATVNVAGFGLTGYYYTGNGIGQTLQLNSGFDAAKNSRDSDGYYVQGTYTLPGVGTKLGVSWGKSNLDSNGVAAGDNSADTSDQMWTIGAYHPLTKHLNLVAEYSDQKHKVNVPNGDGKAKTFALGAIMFF